MKKTEILYEILYSKKSFFSKDEKIKLIKSQKPHPNEENALRHKVFQERYNSFIKVISDISFIIDKKGNITDYLFSEDYSIKTNIFEKHNNITEILRKETNCEFFAKVAQTIKQHIEFTITLQIEIENATHTFEGIISYFDTNHCLVFATDLSISHENIDIPENVLNTKLDSLIHEKDELEYSNKQLITKNRDLIDSITYAKKIQRAIFPEPKSFQKIFKDSFIHFQPKDIVSGDMYWFEKYEDTIVLAVVDCTGHGVPGAFIAILAYSLMNKILSEKNVRFKQPSELLSELHFELTNILNLDKTETEVKDGMDIGLCLINQPHSILYFSGAFHNLYHVNNGKLNIIKGDKLSVGGGNYGKKEIFRFNTTAINYDEDDAFYLTTDGYLDQFGGERNKKFLNRRFRNMIEKNHGKHMSSQIDNFKNQYNLWKGDNEQVDDILVVGFKCKF